MATSDKVTSIDSLSKDERALVVASITLKMASVARAAKGEANPAVAELRNREYAALNQLAVRFS